MGSSKVARQTTATAASGLGQCVSLSRGSLLVAPRMMGSETMQIMEPNPRPRNERPVLDYMRDIISKVDRKTYMLTDHPLNSPKITGYAAKLR